MTTTDKKKPVAKVQSGPVTGAIWENEGKEGSFYSATFECSYKDGEKYKNATSYGPSDLAHLVMCGMKASHTIDALLASREKGSR